MATLRVAVEIRLNDRRAHHHGFLTTCDGLEPSVGLGTLALVTVNRLNRIREGVVETEFLQFQECRGLDQVDWRSRASGKGPRVSS